MLKKKLSIHSPLLSFSKTFFLLHSISPLAVGGSPFFGPQSLCVCFFVYCLILYRKISSLWVNAKGQQFVGVQVVEGSQVRQAQQDFGEEAGVVWTSASDQ